MVGHARGRFDFEPLERCRYRARGVPRRRPRGVHRRDLRPRAGLDPVVFETMEGVEEAWDGEEAFVSSLEKQKRVRDAMRAQATKSGAACHPRDDPVTNVDVSEGSTVHGPDETRRRAPRAHARWWCAESSCRSRTSHPPRTTPAKDRCVTLAKFAAVVAASSGGAAGLAAERWHGPVTSPSTLRLRPGRRSPNRAQSPRAVAGVSAARPKAARRPRFRRGALASVLREKNRLRLLRWISTRARSATVDLARTRSGGCTRASVCSIGTAATFANAETRRRIAQERPPTERPPVSKRKRKRRKPFRAGWRFAAWACAPCARVRPMLASVVAEYDRDRVRLVEMDIETDADTADALGVAGTPTALFYGVRSPRLLETKTTKREKRNRRRSNRRRARRGGGRRQDERRVPGRPGRDPGRGRARGHPGVGSETRVRGDETDATNGRARRRQRLLHSGALSLFGAEGVGWSLVEDETKVAASSFKFSVGATTPARRIGTREG